jgi:hypothetical protein
MLPVMRLKLPVIVAAFVDTFWETLKLVLIIDQHYPRGKAKLK